MSKVHIVRLEGNISEVKSVISRAVSARFDDRNLIEYGGLVSVVRLAERCGLPDLVSDLLRWKSSANSAGAWPVVKMLTLVFGMVTSADDIDGMNGWVTVGWVERSPASGHQDS